MLLVVLSHAGLSSLRGGYVGVDVFFVLSGFLITGLLTAGAAKSGYSSLAEFYSRRARRILPAAALTLVVTDIAAYALLNFVRAKGVLQDSISASLFTANFHFAGEGTNYFAQSQPPSPIQHFWSLAVEEQFYLVWPLILLLILAGLSLRRRARRASGARQPKITVHALRRLDVAIALIVAGSLAWSVYYTHSHPSASYFSTFSRAWELGFGAALAIAATRLARLPASLAAGLGWVGLVCIAFAAVRFSASTSFPGYQAVLPCAGAVLVILAGLGERQARLAPGRLLSLRPLRYIGDRSYAFYLWHWPVLIIAMLYVGHPLPLRTNLLLVAGAFVLSVVSYAAFENPIRRMRWTPSSRALVLWPVSVVAVLLVAGWGIGHVDTKATRLASLGAPMYPGYESGSARSSQPSGSQQFQSSAGGPLAAVVASVHAAQRAAAIPGSLTPPAANLAGQNASFPAGCFAVDGQSASRICTLGDSIASQTIAVMGDSHSRMWAPALLALAGQGKWEVRPIEKDGCRPRQWWHVSAVASDCSRWYQWAIAQIQVMRPAVALISAAFWDLGSHTTQGAAGIAALVSQLRPYVKHVIVLGDTPEQGQQPVDCLLAGGANMRRCSLRPAAADLATQEAIASGARRAGGAYIDPLGWFCAEGICPMVIGNTIAYTDADGHITSTYAGELAAPFRQAFEAAIAPTRAASQTEPSPSAALPQVVAAVQAVKAGSRLPVALTPSPGSLLGDHYDYPSGCGAEPGQSQISVCTLGAASTTKSIVLMGDSHAQMWMPDLLSFANHAGWALRPIGKSACIPLEWWGVDRATPDCSAWYQWAVSEIKALHPTVAILAADFEGLAGYNGKAAAGISTLVRRVKPFVKQVVVLADVPPQPQQPIDCLLSSNATMTRCSMNPAPAQLDLGRALKGAAQGAGARYIDTTPWFCYQNTCPMVVGHTVVYVDPGHITATYATQLAAPFRTAIEHSIGIGSRR